MKVFTTIGNICMGVILLLSAVGIVSSVYPIPGGVEVRIVKSGSMEPAIMTGGLIIMRPANQYAEGDIITFTSRDSVIPTTHRIVGTEGESGALRFVTKGDANEERDTETVPQGDVLGKVLFSLPYAGFILDFARQPLGFALLIGIPALLIVFDELEKIWCEVARIRRKKVADIRAAIEPLIVGRYVPPPYRTRMIDINKPVQVPNGYVRKLDVSPMEPPTRPPLRANARWMLAAGASAIALLVVSSFAPIRGTLSLPRDGETSTGNTFTADVLDFEVSPDSTAYTFTDGVIDDPDGALISTITLLPGSPAALYDLTVGNVTGDVVLCESIEAEVASPFAYGPGPLGALTAEDVVFDGPSSMLLTLVDAEGIENGDTCTLDMTYRAWNAIYSASNFFGYQDEEVVTLTFTAHATNGIEGLVAPLSAMSVVVEENTEGGDGGGKEEPQPDEAEPASEETETDDVPPSSDDQPVEETVIEDGGVGTEEMVGEDTPAPEPGSEPEPEQEPEP